MLPDRPSATCSEECAKRAVWYFSTRARAHTHTLSLSSPPLLGEHLTASSGACAMGQVMVLILDDGVTESVPAKKRGVLMEIDGR